MRGIINGKLILKDGIALDKVLLFDERIIDIVPKDEINLSGVEIIDAGGNFVSAGFINIHVHGCSGYDVMDEEGLEEISKGLLKTGVTSFLATTMSMEWEKVEGALNRIRAAMKNNRYANVLGAHLEGPFISRKYKGAHDENYLMEPNYERIESFRDVIKIITVAPELKGAVEFIKRCSEDNIIVSIGHSCASLDEMNVAIDQGARHITHLFNAMPQLHHRNPSVLGAAFTRDVTCEIIPDNIHVHPSLYEFVVNVKGKDRVIIITDSNRACLLEDGVYDLGGQDVYVKNKKATLKDGTIAGSILPMNEGIRNFYENTSLELWEVVNMATLNPAKLLGIDDKKGSIEKGKDAEFCVLDDRFEVVRVIK
ncbi:N-acetylglucosamine-6-phosphate deacetylase [Caloramator mitchellensis]|uniref:N-acetylglucosamine-6-phosphate deacetylase n=1 Tax=Caloramator mitchellensis TaxID=908809 RepID=A0A0R3JVW9_CALMK|nr:N-acetylglucosamine-6-phosphate deacetylase [Caloramator mitchellensis]KRQ86461.1 N-acetylglucosamine-6-phosphate deacetylase [Caloramator mitchellensis]